MTSITYPSTTDFELTHGKKPRGKGNWFLSIKLSGPHGPLDTMFVNHNGTLSEAKKKAKYEANKMTDICFKLGKVINHVEINVRP